MGNAAISTIRKIKIHEDTRDKISAHTQNILSSHISVLNAKYIPRKVKKNIKHQTREFLTNGVASSYVRSRTLVGRGCRWVHLASARSRSVVVHFNLGNQEDVVRCWGAGGPFWVARARAKR